MHKNSIKHKIKTTSSNNYDLPFDKKLVNQSHIARLLNVHPAHINKIINGKYKGRPEYAQDVINQIKKILKAA